MTGNYTKNEFKRLISSNSYEENKKLRLELERALIGQPKTYPNEKDKMNPPQLKRLIRWRLKQLTIYLAGDEFERKRDRRKSK